MQLKASTDYALRAVIYLAMDGGVVSSKKIAEDIVVPRDYLIQLSQLLRNANIIEARAGKNGGYALARDPSEISFLDVVNAIDDGTRSPKDEGASDHEPPQTSIMQGLHTALELVSHSFDAYLDSITIAALAECAQDTERGCARLKDGAAVEGLRTYD